VGKENQLRQVDELLVEGEATLYCMIGSVRVTGLRLLDLDGKKRRNVVEGTSERPDI
jgi:hypothetical protein